VDQKSIAPEPKIAAAGVAGAFTVLLVYAASELGLVLPPEVAAALTTLSRSGRGT
jgi:hypothetical protein